MASPVHPYLAPLRPKPCRDAGLQVLVVIVALTLLLLAVSLLPGVWWLPFLGLATLTILLMAQSLYGQIGRQQPGAGQGSFRRHYQRGTPQIHVFVAGFALDSAATFGACHPYEDIEPGSYAEVIRAAGESILFFFYDRATQLDPSESLTHYANAYDELELFRQLHAELDDSGHELVTLHLQSMGADFGRRFIAWIEQHQDDRLYQIVAVHYVQGSFRLRPVIRLGLTALHIYGGSPALQWLWQHGLYNVFPRERQALARCRADGREAVYTVVRYWTQFLSVQGLLSRMNALRRSRAWEVLEDETPDYAVYVSDLSTDETVDHEAGWRIVRAVYGIIPGRFFRKGKRRDIGHHGTLAEWGPAWQEAARKFLDHRDQFIHDHDLLP